jgi:acetyl esterase
MLDPQLQPMFDRLAREFPQPPETLAPQEIRRIMDSMVQSPPPRPAHMEVSDVLVPVQSHQVPVRIYRPKAIVGPAPALIYFHGGGWMWGSIDSHDQVCLKIAQDAGVVVINVGYRLAPEHAFPAQVDDSIGVLRWVAQEAIALDIDPHRIAIGGDSAGANLATVAALIAKREGAPAVSFQLLFYPGIDTAFDLPSFEENRDAPVLSTAMSKWIWRQYLGPYFGSQDDRAVPMHATDLAGMPPAMILVANHDPLRDEGVLYAQKLIREGVSVELRSAARLPHGYVRAFAMSSDVREELDAACASLRRALLVKS